MDDTVVIAKKVGSGVFLKDDGSLICCEAEVVESLQVEDDVSTAKVICDIASMLEGDICITYDSPSQNSDGKMPVLDLKVWMDENFNVKFKVFEKDMASRVTIMKDSALK